MLSVHSCVSQLNLWSENIQRKGGLRDWEAWKSEGGVVGGLGQGRWVTGGGSEEVGASHYHSWERGLGLIVWQCWQWTRESVTTFCY